MLQHLTIENYALIKSLQIDFEKGFTVITGETGSGKSIILGALGLLLGQRADVGVLFDKEKKCIVEATFDIKDLGLKAFFEKNDLDYDDTLLLRREIQPSGKSRAFINDTPAALQIMKDLGSYIIDIHSQHQTLTLKDSDFQLKILDEMCDDNTTLAQYKEKYAEYKSLRKELALLEDEDKKNKLDLDYYQFLFNELNDEKLQSDEQAELEQEIELLNNVEGIKTNLSAVLEACHNSDNSLLSQLVVCKNMLNKASVHYAPLAEVASRFDSAIIELKDIVSEVDSIDGELQYSPQRQDEISSRLDTIYRLETKHNVATVAELLEIQNNLDERLQNVMGLDDRIDATRKQLKQAESELQTKANLLTKLRQKSAEVLEKQILPILSDLGMKDSKFKVEIETTADFLSSGCNSISFMFNANKGGQLGEIGKTISGGELSRVMLAIKSLITSKTLLPTIIFDEIDTGVSGEISSKVGNIMKQMSATTQVFAITHLPQIAAKSDTHLKVYKQEEDNRTLSKMLVLTDEQKVEEVAKMLSSNTLTDAAIATAKELTKL
ncbi:MAG: DNA repair protein RecN [Bacteroidales bacterium]|nr:DNA repair protein RecN [Bacteroidales bacterium]